MQPGKNEWVVRRALTEQGITINDGVASPEDVDAAAARIEAAGGALLSQPADQPWGARMFQFNDLDGFKLGVSTPLGG